MPYTLEARTSETTTFAFKGLSPLPHLHSHLELLLMTQGSSVATVDYKDYLIEEGDLFLAFPNQIHYYHDREACSGYMAIFPYDLYQELKALFQNKVPSSSVVKRENLPPLTGETLEKIVTGNNAESYFDRLTAKGLLLALLGELLPQMTLAPKPADQDSFKNILSFCAEKYTEPLSLDILSGALHLNKYYISHIFKERMGISFPDFINNLRVEHACRLLEKDSSMTEVAYSSGFSSIRSFNRAFSKNMGMAPREYVRQKEQGILLFPSG